MADVAYVQLSGASSTATLGLYAGMPPHELQQLVCAALNHRKGVCAGFQVAPAASNSRKKRHSSSIQRLVPLSVACKAPQLLSGRVSALFTPSAASPSALKPQNEAATALESEQKLSSFESAMLRDLCEQQSARVLAVVAGDASVDQKKRFLLDLLRPAGSNELKKELRAPKNMDNGEESLHAELVAKKESLQPQVQMQVLALSREGWKSTGSKADSRFVDTMELLNLVERLLDKHVLPEEHEYGAVERSTQLQERRRQFIDLETTAKRLAALGIDPPPPITSKKPKGKSPKKQSKHSSPAKKRVRNPAATPWDDTQVLQILRDFEQSERRDVDTLRDALVSIVEEITMELGDEEKAAAAFARGLDDAVQEESSLNDSDDDSDSLGWQRHLSFLLGQWQAQHHLTPTAAKTLQKMVAQRHNLLESAYEVFAGDGDASELLDTLQRVAKLQRQIEQSQAGQTVQNAAVSGVSLEDVVRQMQRRGTIQAGDAAGLLVLLHGGNEALQAANEAFQADEDVHELEETLLLVVKHARFGSDAEDEAVDEVQTVSRILAEFGRSGRLELWQIQLLMSLLKAHDPRLLAAVDVYDEDRNTEEFVDTLEILVELAAWERHRRAMRLVQLVKARDDRVVAALVVFLSDNNKDEFVDTLARIACLEAMNLKNVQADESKEGHLVLDLLKELEEKGVEELVCSGETRMLAAMDVLSATHDAEDFADTARRILAKTEERQEEKNTQEECAKAEPASDAAVTKEQESRTGEPSSQVSEKSTEQSSAEGPGNGDIGRAGEAEEQQGKDEKMVGKGDGIGEDEEVEVKEEEVTEAGEKEHEVEAKDGVDKEQIEER
ncbi:hypothetical protein GQ600_23234 [Phytophthora cactorum]|nr:hypothetical protein GQ600_23234 [Phytophthora cactorum]